MKIKTTKEMNILELAQAVRDGEVLPGEYESKYKVIIGVSSVGIRVLDVPTIIISYQDTFTVETLEEMTEDTPIPVEVFGVYLSDGCLKSGRWTAGAKISEIKDRYFHYEFIAFYKEKGGQIIWDRHTSFVDGVLEVD